MKVPVTLLRQKGVANAVLGEEQGSDSKYWIFFKDGWGYYEYGQREDHCWISGGVGVDSISEFVDLKLEQK